MKQYISMGLVLAAGIALTGCDDFLNDNRYPLSEQVNEAGFWNSEVNVEGQINHLYNDYLGYGNASGGGNFYFKTLSDDQIATTSGTFQNWYNTNVPSSSSDWNDPYTSIRLCNLIIQGVEASTFDSETKNSYLGEARLNRAYQYYKLVRAYGDVPLVTIPLDPSDEAELYGPRVSRDQVMDFVLADIDFAAENISRKSDKNYFSRDLAQAMKTEICLFEGAYAKYNAGNTERANKYFGEVVKAANAIMGSYSLCDDYQSLFNSVRVEAGGIPGLTANPEVIFMKAYENNVFMHSLLDWTSSSTPIAGITKDAFDNYLFTDGKPAASTTCDKTDIGELVQIGTDEKGEPIYEYSIAKLLAVRDKRLAATTNDVVYFNGLPKKYDNTMSMTSSSGYGVKKYRNDLIGYTATTTANKAYTCAPLYWLAEIYLAYAEARAELNQLTDTDINNTLNKLYDRAGLPAQTKASLETMADPANNMGVPSLIWEIRRCRRCELIMDNDIRYWDLVRWNQLELLDSNKHPNILLGANVTAAKTDKKDYTTLLTLKNGYIDGSRGSTRVFSAREKLFPVPGGQRLLNPALTQNPGWE